MDFRTKFVLLLILVLIAALNIATSEIFPIVWGDEIMFTDAAVNLAVDGSFVSTAWYSQSDALPWASNAPLYSLLLSGWIKIFGFSITAVRSINILFFSAAVFIFCATLRRERLLTTPLLLWAFALVALLDYGHVLNYRSGRYDGLGILLVAIAAWAAPRRDLVQKLAFPLACLAMPASGVQVAMATGLSLFIALAVFRAAAVPAFLIGGISLALGGAIMLGTFAALGVLDVFIATANDLRTVAPGSVPKDPSFVLVVLAALVQMIRLRRLAWWRQPQLLLLAAVGLLLPPVIYVMGRFPTYYAWMSVLPLAALTLALFQLEFAAIPRRTGLAVGALLTGACLVGLPLQIASGFSWGEGRNYAHVRSIVQDLKATDVAVIDPAAYYAVRPRAGKTYMVQYVTSRRWLTPQQLDAVTALVLKPEEFQAIARIIGGDWKAEGRTPAVTASPFLFRKNFGDKLVETYDLQVYRRAPAQGG